MNYPSGTCFSPTMQTFPLTRVAGASLLALLLIACTESKTPNIPAPTPTPTTPTTPTAPAAVNADSRDYADYTELQWADEFNGSGAIDPAKWMFDLGAGGWGNREFETYTNSTDNVYQSGGNLVIQALQTSGGYTSGRVLTKNKKDFQFGRIDVRAKLPQGVGIWPAIWMLGSDIDTNNWPKCGEVDIMELRGQTPTETLTTLHYADQSGNHQQSGIDHIKLPDGSSFANDFHTYSVVRSTNQVRFYLDGQLYYTFTKSMAGANTYPFNNNFFVVLNVAVGGDFVGNPSMAAINAATTFPKQMQVDYVRYYQYK
ncbi:glycoside hydrolase family 16 protein [Hymenobacter sp. UV11]|nr:glycoside hydrolase family 16 protein [Hymenobacter sp. UV11]